MTWAERKREEMRKIKAAFDKAKEEGTIVYRDCRVGPPRKNMPS